MITRKPSFDLEQLIGQSVTFTCVVSGIPTPTVTWYHNGAQLSADGVISISGNSPNVSVLFISSLAVEHTGMYQCFASNVVGRTQASWALQVRISGEGIAHPPTLTYIQMLLTSHNDQCVCLSHSSAFHIGPSSTKESLRGRPLCSGVLFYWYSSSSGLLAKGWEYVSP